MSKNSWSYETVEKLGLGPAHPNHPLHHDYYTKDGISLTEVGAETLKLVWNAEHNNGPNKPKGALVKASKIAVRHEQ